MEMEREKRKIQRFSLQFSYLKTVLYPNFDKIRHFHDRIAFFFTKEKTLISVPMKEMSFADNSKLLTTIIFFSKNKRKERHGTIYAQNHEKECI